MTTLHWITNIPTPYRTHRYDTLHEVGAEHGFALHVHYMSHWSQNRPWRFGSSDLAHPHTFHVGVQPRALGTVFHMNPALPLAVRRARPDIAIVGGYSTPSHLLTSLALPRTALRLLSIESHLLSNKHGFSMSSPMRLLKGRILAAHDGFVVTSERSRELVETLAPEAAHRPFILLPNLIDARLFREGVHARRPEAAAIRERLGVAAETQLWLCPARLERFKGIDDLLPHLEGLDRVHLCIAGTGSQHDALADEVARRKLPVSLLGQRDQNEMIDLYAAADLFVLPSRQDPNPLSPIEAIAAGLPLLVSDRIGNIAEVLDEGANGWRYRVEQHDANRATLQAIAAQSRERLAEMGRHSTMLYGQTFESRPALERFCAQLREALDARRG